MFSTAQAYLEVAGARHDYARAQVWLLPAALGAHQLTPAGRTALLRAYVPDLDRLAQQLAARRVPADTISRFIFRG